MALYGLARGNQWVARPTKKAFQGLPSGLYGEDQEPLWHAGKTRLTTDPSRAWITERIENALNRRKLLEAAAGIVTQVQAIPEWTN